MNKQKENLDKLFQLIKENPELPIVPMVYSEIVADVCFAFWVGNWGKVEIDKYLITDEHVYLYSLDNEYIILENSDIADKFISRKDYMSMSDKELKQAFENLPWIEAIIVNIDLPEL